MVASFFFPTPTWGNDPNWRIFFECVGNQPVFLLKQIDKNLCKALFQRNLCHLKTIGRFAISDGDGKICFQDTTSRLTTKKRSVSHNLTGHPEVKTPFLMAFSRGGSVASLDSWGFSRKPLGMFFFFFVSLFWWGLFPASQYTKSGAGIYWFMNGSMVFEGKLLY